MKKYDNSKLIGQKFGKLTIIGFVEKVFYARGGSVKKVKCKCECHKEVIVALSNLRTGHTMSCGCLNKELVAARVKTHGLKKHPLYVVWSGMKGRCYNHKNNAYKDYGGRGICVSQDWMDFKVFYDWAMSNGYKEGLEIDRFPNINGDYEPANCRFANQEQQQNNKRNNRKFLYEGELLGIRQIARKMGVNPGTLSSRFYHKKRPLERLFEPVKKVKIQL